MDGEASSVPDLGETLQAKGWRQCCVFRPDDLSVLPLYLQFNPDTEWLALSTQSCSVCARGPDAEPIVEVIVVTPIETYDAKASLAKGGVVRRLHLPVSGLESFKGILLDISRRAFLPKALLANWKPSDVYLDEKALITFKGWISRYYGRVAIPNELDRRLKDGGKSVVRTVSRLLEKKLSAKDVRGNTERYAAYEDIKQFYISWTPVNDECAHDENYNVSLLIVCYREETKSYLQQELQMLRSGYKGDKIVNGICIDVPDVRTVDDLLVASLSGMHLFTHWDELSDAAELLRDRAAL